MRRTSLDANTFQNNAIVATPTNPKEVLPPEPLPGSIRLVQVDGPIRIPRHPPQRRAGETVLHGHVRKLSRRHAEPADRLLSRGGNAQGRFLQVDEFDGAEDHDLRSLHCHADSDGNTISQSVPGQHHPHQPAQPDRAGGHAVHAAAEPGCAGRDSAMRSSNLSIPSFFDKDKFYNLILKFDCNIGNKHRAFFRHALQRPHRRSRRQRHRQQAGHRRPTALPAH